MSVTNKLLKLRPDSLWVFNGTGFDNIKGSSSITGTPTADITIDKNNVSSARFNNASQGTVPVPAFVSGTASYSFTIGGQFMPAGSTSVSLLGTSGGEGLLYENGFVKFVTIQNGNTYSAEFNYQDIGNKLIAGVHEREANYLYVDGEQVASISIDYADQDSDFSNVTGSLKVGAGDGNVLCDNIFYAGFVVDAGILQQAAAENFIESLPYNTSGGGSFILSSESVQRSLEAFIGENYSGVYMNGATVEELDNVGKVITPYESSGLTIPGQAYFTMSVGESSGVPVVIGGSNVSWSAVGSVVVEASVDGGVTYSVCQNGQSIPGATAGTDMDNKDVLFRVTFGGGTPYLGQYIYNISAVAHTDTSLSSSDAYSDSSIGGGIYLPPIETSAIDYSGTWASRGRITVSNPISSYSVVEMLIKIGDTSGTQRVYQVGDTSSPQYFGVSSGSLDFSGVDGAVLNGNYSATPSMSVYEGQVLHVALLVAYKSDDIYLLADHLEANPFLGSMMFFNIHNDITQAEAEALYQNRLTEQSLVCLEAATTINLDNTSTDAILFGSTPATVTIS